MSNKNELTQAAYEAKKPPYAFVWVLAIIAALVLWYFATGCATIKSIVTNPDVQELAMEQLDKLADKWIAKAKKLPPIEKPTVADSATVDAIPFSSLVWQYGGFNASGATLDRVTLADMRFDGKRISYRWVQGLGAWGLANSEAGAICAVFFLRDGVWVGGKFDWVSTSRPFRDIHHVESYVNWKESGFKVPVRLPCAFVVTSADGKRRSNVVVWGI